MTSSKTLPRKSARGRIFTVEEANATLPLVRAIVSDIVELSRELMDRRQRLSQLSAKDERKPHDPFEEELTQVERELEQDARRLREYMEELRILGVEPASSAEGVVDFPAQIDGRKVLLCWKHGEAHVGYWHNPGEGFRQRSPLSEGGSVGVERKRGGRGGTGPKVSHN